MDTESAEVDISNGFGIIKGLSQCESVRPVLIFSWLRMGDRGT